MKVFEENIVNKMAGQPENELANNATIRFELDDCHYTVRINKAQELQIHKIATSIKEKDVIKVTALSSNTFCLS